MRLIAITTPGFRENEAGEIRRLLDGGWWRVHIRKPGSDPESVVRLLREIPRGYYPRLSLHDHFPLAGEFGLGGVHLNSRNPRAPRGWNGLVSRSCHTLEEIQQGDEYDYQFLSPVFDSISSRATSAGSLRRTFAGPRLSPIAFSPWGASREAVRRNCGRWDSPDAPCWEPPGTITNLCYSS